MIDLAQILGRVPTAPLDPVSTEAASGTFSATIFALDGIEISGHELFRSYPALGEMSDDLPALEVAATAVLLLKHLKESRLPRILRTARHTSMYRMLYGQRTVR